MAKHPGGRPLKFQSVTELQEKIDAYFESCWEVDEKTKKRVQVEPYLITGLAVALGTSRQTLVNYALKDKFIDTIKAAKTKCEAYAEKVCMTGRNQAGAIFCLKNYGWKDKQEIDIRDVTKKTDDELKAELMELDGG